MKTGNKSVISVILVVVMLLSFVGSVYAITGSIGNARMILRPDIGDKIEKSILVKNVNDVAVNIELTVIGDLENDIKLKEEAFTLQAGDEKKAYFTINVKKAGTTETKINVKFSPIDGGNGVGLSSTIIVIPEGKGESEGGSFFDIFGGGDDDDEEMDEGVTFGKQDDTEEVVDADAVEGDKSSVGLMAVGGTFTIILFVALLILLVIGSKHIQKRKTSKASKDASGHLSKSKKSSK